jgi:hypothetical protein
MSFRAKRELLAQVAPRYQHATHIQKSLILDEFIAATGYARKYAIRLLTQPVAPPEPDPPAATAHLWTGYSRCTCHCLGCGRLHLCQASGALSP